MDLPLPSTSTTSGSPDPPVPGTSRATARDTETGGSPPKLVRQDGTFYSASIESSDYVNDGGTTGVFFDDEDKNEWATIKFISNKLNAPSQLFHDLIDPITKEIREDNADLVFVCVDAIPVKAHKIVFALFSTFFGNILKEQANTPLTTIILDSVDAKTCKIVRKLAYGCPQPLVDILGKIDLKNVCQLLSTFQLNPDSFVVNGGEIPTTYWPKPLTPPNPQSAPTAHNHSNIVWRQPGTGADRVTPSTPATGRRQPLRNFNCTNEYRAILKRANCEMRTVDIRAQGIANKNRGENMDPDTARRVHNWVEQSTPSNSPAQLECIICEPPKTFDDPDEHEWHVERHFDHKLFKCIQCGDRFTNDIQLKNHEETTECLPIRKKKTDSAPPNKRKGLSTSMGPQKPRSSLPGFGFVQVETNDTPRRRKIPVAGGRVRKQDRRGIDAHYKYKCKYCDHCCSNNEGAVEHGRTCPGRPRTTSPENSYVKEAIGFHGRFECPISNCPKRFLSLMGFSIHSGQVHPDYKQKFISNYREATINCGSCRQGFSTPLEFNNHLNPQTGHCPSNTRLPPPEPSPQRSVTFNLSMPQNSSGTYTFNQLPGGSGLRASIKTNVTNVNVNMPGTSGATTSRVTQPAKSPSKAHRRPGPQQECPFCGEDQDDVVHHIFVYHRDLNVRVSYPPENAADNAVKCDYCDTTLAVCDLLAHRASCKRNEIPLGGSRIDRMDSIDLLNPDFLVGQLVCRYCNKQCEKLADAQKCLRSHAIHRCSLCFNSYRNNQSYSEHLRVVHKNSDEETECPIPHCSKVFSQTSSTVYHVYMKHWVPILREVLPENKWTQSMFLRTSKKARKD